MGFALFNQGAWVRELFLKEREKQKTKEKNPEESGLRIT